MYRSRSIVLDQHTVDGCEIRSHHLEAMVETIVCWYLQGNQIIPGFSGGSGFRPSTVWLIPQSGIAASEKRGASAPQEWRYLTQSGVTYNLLRVLKW